MWKLNRYPFDLAKLYAWSSAVQRIAAVRVVPAALPHLPAFSGVTSLKYWGNSGCVKSLTLPSHLSFPQIGNAGPDCAAATPPVVAAPSAATAAAAAILARNISLSSQLV